MDQQVKQEQTLGNAVIDTKSYLPLIAVKNGNVVTMFTDGFVDLSHVSTLRLPDSRFAYVVKFYEQDSGARIDTTPTKAIMVEAGRTTLEINESSPCFVEAELIAKENQ
jgi:hypothetical protein